MPTPPIESDIEDDAAVNLTSGLKTDSEEEDMPKPKPKPEIVVKQAEPTFMKKPTQREDMELVKIVPQQDKQQFLNPPAIDEKEEKELDTSLLQTDPHETEEVDGTKFVVNNEDDEDSQDRDNNFVEEEIGDENSRDEAVSEFQESQTSQREKQKLGQSQPISALSGQSGGLEVAPLGEQQIEVGPLIIILQIMADVNGRFIVVAVGEQTTQKMIVQDKVIALQPDDEETQIEELAQLFTEAFGEAVEALVLDQETGDIQEDWAENLFDYISNEF